MNYTQQITKIRDRGQLTIPQEIRKALDWTEKDVLVKVETIPHGFKVERLPISHPQHPKKKLTPREWQEIKKGMKSISKMGKQSVSLSQFLRQDRNTHF